MPEVQLPYGVTLNYRLDGSSGPLVLLVNGLTMDLSLWQNFTEQLTSCRVLRYDQRGQGASGKPAGPYLQQQHAADLNALLDRLEADDVLPRASKPHLAGLSNGGIVALLAAGQRPERFASLTLLNSYLETDVKLRLALESWQQAHQLGGNALRFAISTPWIWGRSFLQRHIDDLEPFRHAPAAIEPHAYQALVTGATLFTSAHTALERYPGPLLAVTGDEDVLTPAAYSQQIIDAAGRGRVETVPGCGHAGPLEQPKAVAALLREFIDPVDSAERKSMTDNAITAMDGTLPPYQSLSVNGLRIAYREAGIGTPLLLVHGNVASSRWFRAQLNEPPLGYRVIAPDLPNYAASDPLPGEITIDAYAQVLLQLLDSLGVSDDARSVVLLGHSLGGAVVQAMAASRPELAAALVLVASAPPAGFVTAEGNYPYLETIPGNETLLRGALQPTIGSVNPDEFEELLHDALLMQPHAFTAGARALAAMDLSSAAEKSDLPVLVLRGTADLIVSAEQAEATHAAYPESSLEVWDGVGHSPQLEAPKRFNALLAQFLEGLP
jgi:pimeloyl-ACP methyl ester carboxylesterase